MFSCRRPSLRWWDEMRWNETIHFIDPQGEIHLSKAGKHKRKQPHTSNISKTKKKQRARYETWLNFNQNAQTNIKHKTKSSVRAWGRRWVFLVLLCRDCSYDHTEMNLEDSVTWHGGGPVPEQTYSWQTHIKGKNPIQSHYKIIYILNVVSKM